jgi:hypothetical protein
MLILSLTNKKTLLLMYLRSNIMDFIEFSSGQIQLLKFEYVSRDVFQF